MVGFTHTSLYADVAGSDMARYDEARAAMREPPHRFGEWAAVFHPKWDQIVGYVRLNPSDWYRLSDAGEVEGPFDMKRRAWPGKCRKVGPGVYVAAEAGWTVFTRANAPEVGLNPEELP
jgi:hypothetical protein